MTGSLEEKKKLPKPWIKYRKTSREKSVLQLIRLKTMLDSTAEEEKEKGMEIILMIVVVNMMVGVVFILEMGK